MTFIVMLSLLSSCSGGSGETAGPDKTEPDTSRFVISVWEEPDTVDFQCTTLYYNIAYNCFDRLVAMETDGKGETSIEPCLAESWEESDDGLVYTFHLRKDVQFSNGAPLTSSDVRYTLERLLTYPDSCNQDIAVSILGADALMEGTADTLEGFEELSDLDFRITLEKPFEAFLACLSMHAASILDEEATEKAGERFGKDPDTMIGTGSFILYKWVPGEGMLLRANPDCWRGAPACDGLDVRFEKDSEAEREMFDSGQLDIIDLDDLDNAGEFYIHGDIYKDRLYSAQQTGTTYVALNESIKPLDDVRVRKALQLAVDRDMLMDTVYGGRGMAVNGIYPQGLYGFNSDIPDIPYDIDEAKELLAQAGYPDGFDMTITVRASATQGDFNISKMVASMWEDVDVHADVKVVEESEFMSLRKAGKLQCYAATWVADYNDPDNFIYTFFGNKEKTTSRSLCYPDEEIMQRVRDARGITDPDKRVQEYRDLELRIIQEDAAWIPLFSRTKYYVTSQRLHGFRIGWTGRFYNNYREMSVD